MATRIILVFGIVAILVVDLVSSHTLSGRVQEEFRGGNSVVFPGQGKPSGSGFGSGGQPVGAVSKGQQGPEYVSVDKSFSNGGSQGGNGQQLMETVLFQVAASGLPGMDAFGGEPDPYILISVNGTSGTYERVERMGTLKNTHEAVWSEAVRFDKYRRGTNQQLQFQVWDYDSVGRDDLIGHAWINIDACLWQSRNTRTEQPACYSQITGGHGILYVNII